MQRPHNAVQRVHPSPMRGKRNAITHDPPKYGLYSPLSVCFQSAYSKNERRNDRTQHGKRQDTARLFEEVILVQGVPCFEDNRWYDEEKELLLIWQSIASRGGDIRQTKEHPDEDPDEDIPKALGNCREGVLGD